MTTDLALRDTLGFLESALPSPGLRLLEVGCGRGELAAALRDLGHQLTALEPDPDAAAEARDRGVPVEEAGLLDHHGGPYDAVLFTRSLHHIHDLDAAVEHALGLLAPAGRLVLEEFAREQADRLTAGFFFDGLGLLESAGVPAHADDLDPAADPLERWTTALAPSDDHPMHTGAALEAAVTARADVTYATRVPYVWRHVVDKLGPHEHADRIGRFLREVERRRIADGSVQPLGLRLVATRRP